LLKLCFAGLASHVIGRAKDKVSGCAWTGTVVAIDQIGFEAPRIESFISDAR